MATMSRLKPLAVLLCAAVAVTACDLFDENAVRDLTGPTPTDSRIKFFNFGVSSPGVNFYANEQKMSAVASTRCTNPTPADTAACFSTGIEATTGIAYAGAAAGGAYMAIAPGQYTLSGKIAAATDNGLSISSVPTAIETGKYYSFYQSGIYNATTKTVDAFVVEDVMPAGAVDFSVAHVRFVNAISNGTGDLNLFATNTTTSTESPVGGAVAYRSAGAFVALPEGTYDVRAAYTGATTNLVTRTGLSFEGGRVYTITARGSAATASTRGLDFTTNQQ